MKRIIATVIFFALFTLVFNGCRDGSGGGYTPFDPEMQWMQSHYDEKSSSHTQSPAPNAENLAWTSGNINAVTLSNLVVVDNSVFVYCLDTVGMNASLVSLRTDNGGIRWMEQVDYPTDTWGTPSPAYFGGMLFFASNSSLVAYDAWSGEEIWSSPLGGYVSNMSPLVTHGLVVLGTDSTGVMKAFDMENGDLVWDYEFPGGGHIASKPVYADGMIFTGGYYNFYTDLGCNAIVAVSIDNGAEEWVHSSYYGIMGDISIGENRLWYVGYNFTGNGTLVSISLEDGGVLTNTSIVSTNAVPVESGGVVYLTSGIDAWYIEQISYFIDAENGSILTTLPFGNWKSAPIHADSKIFISNLNVDGTGCDAFYALNPTSGDILWSSSAGGGGTAIAEGRIYTIGSDGRVRCYR